MDSSLRRRVGRGEEAISIIIKSQKQGEGEEEKLGKWGGKALRWELSMGLYKDQVRETTSYP